jgi:uncharacterized protein (TIGR00297 family)
MSRGQTRTTRSSPPFERSAGAHSETARQVVHMSMAAFALLLRWIPWWGAVVLALAAVLFNLFVLRALAPALFRAGDDRRTLHGIAFYPLAVLGLLLCFPRRLDIAASAWGVLALGDGAATLAGRALGGPRWPWNREKTLTGTLAFLAAGSLAAVFLAWWCGASAVGQPPWLRVAALPIAACIAAAFVETIPIRLDDNLSVAFAAGAVLWLGSLIAAGAITPALDILRQTILIAVAVNAIVAAAGYRAHTVSRSGAIVGAMIGTGIFAATGWRGWTLLLLTFVAASVSSRVGLRHKTLLGIAEARGGRRGAGNAIANTGVALVSACLILLTGHPGAASLAFAAALAAGGSDTIASEVGKALGRRTWSITSFARVPAGTSGAMSLEGTAAGVLGALALGAAAAALHIVPATSIGAIVIGATAGALLESYLGATLEAPGILNNDVLNFINTAAAAAVAVVVHAAAA